MPITKTDIDKLEPNSILWDTGRGSVAGFGARRQRVHPVFFVKYTDGGRQRWFTIGKYGAPWTVDLARTEALRVLGQVASGNDPAGRRDQKKNSPTPETVSDLCDRYMKAAEAGAILTRFNRPKKASTLEIDKGRISRHIKPLIGDSLVTEIDPKSVKRLIEDITVGKTAAIVKTKLRGRALVTGGAATAARVADLLSGIMTWAVEEEIIERNPVHRVRRFRSEPRQRFLNSKELATLGAVLTKGCDAKAKAFHPFAIKIIRLLCLTGCRVGEIAGLRWSELDADMQCLRLDDTKSGRSVRPVGKVAVDQLQAHPRQAGSPYVFTGATGIGPYQGVGKEAGRIFEAAELHGVTPHTLRHTFASVASGLGYSDGTIAGLLGHKGRGVTSRYVHRPDQALLSAAEAISAEIARQLSGLTAQCEEVGGPT
ncbi:site-specific integrase [Mesorhizobium sp. CC13]|uniref:tyrosine-type recombinase/integrase n=1 Tax=Mesorhizobium sp. CC13 TaxID=3029194 RepID=UPI003263CBEC